MGRGVLGRPVKPGDDNPYPFNFAIATPSRAS
jgi:hypothetical protein